MGRPQVAYRETIRKKAGAEGKYIRQTGGSGQYGHCKIEIHPLPEFQPRKHARDVHRRARRAGQGSCGGGRPASGDLIRNTGCSSSTRLWADRFPRSLSPPIEAGIREAMENGILAGFPTCGFAVVLIDGSYHDVDSNGNGVQDRRLDGLQGSLQQGQAGLLEPIMKVEVVVPEEYMADVFGDLNSRRCRIQGTENRARRNDDSRGSAAGGDVWVCHRFAQPHAGPRDVSPCISRIMPKLPAAMAEEVIAKATGKDMGRDRPSNGFAGSASIELRSGASDGEGKI